MLLLLTIEALFFFSCLLLQSNMFYYYLLAVYYAAGFYLSFSLAPSLQLTRNDISLIPFFIMLFFYSIIFSAREWFWGLKVIVYYLIISSWTQLQLLAIFILINCFENRQQKYSGKIFKTASRKSWADVF